MPGPYRTQAEAIAALRRRTPRWKVPFPDLSVEQRTSPCSDIIAIQSVVCAPTAKLSGAKQFPIGNQHKQGLELITPGMIPHLQYLSGRKS